jgi:hypothetical protein
MQISLFVIPVLDLIQDRNDRHNIDAYLNYDIALEAGMRLFQFIKKCCFLDGRQNFRLLPAF